MIRKHPRGFAKTPHRTGLVPQLAFLLVAISAGTASAADRSPHSITDGELAGICDFPSVVALVELDDAGALVGGCTAAVVAPRLILTAGHCVDNDAFDTVIFGSDVEDPDAPDFLAIGVEQCVAHPEFELTFAANDVGYCVLSADAPDIPMVPPLAGCEAEILSPGRQLLSVGYGRTESASAGGDAGRGIKRWGQQEIQPLEFLTNNIVTLGDNATACNGDSGGPALVEFPDGSWRIAGISSTVHPTSGNRCGVGNVYEVLHTLLPWIESDSGVDITPCHDADGTWNPSEACGGFSIELRDNGSSWDEQCQTANVTGLSSTCGEPWEDPEPTGETEDTGTSSGGDAAQTSSETIGEAADATGTAGTTGFAAATDGTGGDAGAADTDDGGCSCSASETDPRGSFGLAVVVLLSGLRRRRSA